MRYPQTSRSQPNKALDVLEATLGAREWLVDGTFGVADVAVGSYLNYVPLFFSQVGCACVMGCVYGMCTFVERASFFFPRPLITSPYLSFPFHPISSP